MTEITAGKVPVVTCVVASWKFLIDNWRQFLPAALIIGVVSGVSPVLLANGGITAGEAYLFALITSLATVFLAAVILRKAVRSEYLAPTGLAFAKDEARLLAVFGSAVLLMLPFVILSAIVYFFVLMGSMNLTPEQMEEMSKDPVAAQAAMQKAMTDLPTTNAGGVLVILAIVGGCILFLVAARLWMVNAATIGEHKIVFFQTWSWSKGNVFRIAAAILMTWGPAQIISYIVANILGGIADAAPSPITLGIAAVIAQTIGAFASIPPTVLGAELYRGLKPPGFVAK